MTTDRPQAPYQVSTLTAPIDSVVRLPGSKSLTIRALFTAALASGESRIRRPLDSEDTRAARRCLRSLGVEIEESSGGWLVAGADGLHATSEPLDAAESGLTARSLMAMAALVEGRSLIVGQGRLPERPMSELGDALRALGADVDFKGPGLPAVVVGTGSIPGGAVVIDGSRTSQFATALLQVAPMAEDTLTVVIDDLRGSAGYLDLTLDVMQSFGADVERSGTTFRVSPTGYRAARYLVEPDASAAAYPMIAAAIAGGRVTVESLGSGSAQPDYRVSQVLAAMGCEVTATDTSTTVAGDGPLKAIDLDLSDAPDGSLAVAVACLFAEGESRISGLGSLRHKESDRLQALAEQIENVGGRARIDGDDLVITPGLLRPAVIRTYSDHRIAMAFAIVGLVQPGIEIEDPQVVAKTWPRFWDFLSSLRTD
jgi:3-phosphoshikimate 1-carboxyvinyltransferase